MRIKYFFITVLAVLAICFIVNPVSVSAADAKLPADEDALTFYGLTYKGSDKSKTTYTGSWIVEKVGKKTVFMPTFRDGNNKLKCCPDMVVTIKTKNVDNKKHVYVTDADGYIIVSKTVEIDGKKYKIDKNGWATDITPEPIDNEPTATPTPTPAPSNGSTTPTGTSTTTPKPTAKNGFYLEGDGYVYYKNDQKQYGLVDVMINKATYTYYCNAYTGKVETGWKYINGKTKYFSPNADDFGQMVKSKWAYIDYRWQYFDSNGDKYVGLIVDNGHLYYIDMNGLVTYGNYLYLDSSNVVSQYGQITSVSVLVVNSATSNLPK